MSAIVTSPAFAAIDRFQASGLQMSAIVKGRFSRLRHRKLLTTIVALALLTGVALVIAQDQETLRIQTSVAATDPQFPA